MCRQGKVLVSFVVWATMPVLRWEAIAKFFKLDAHLQWMVVLVAQKENHQNYDKLHRYIIQNGWGWLKLTCSIMTWSSMPSFKVRHSSLVRDLTWLPWLIVHIIFDTFCYAKSSLVMYTLLTIKWRCVCIHLCMRSFKFIRAYRSEFDVNPNCPTTYW